MGSVGQGGPERKGIAWGRILFDRGHAALQVR